MTKRELFPIHLQENAILVIKPTGVRIFTEFKTSQDSSISTKVERFSFLWSGYYSELLPFTTLNNRWTVGYPMERHPLRKFPQRKTPPDPAQKHTFTSRWIYGNFTRQKIYVYNISWCKKNDGMSAFRSFGQTIAAIFTKCFLSVQKLAKGCRYIMWLVNEG